ncbi:MAG TPA: hypothetical protein VGH42_04540 [Verrucomicrobiae bacterium]|jgi:hypothetical protein
MIRGAICICVAAIALVLLSGCVGTKYLYSPVEQMVTLQSHNHLLEIGPCGVPWNFDDQINILLPDNSYKCDASQLQAYQNGKLKIDSGFVILDRTNKTITIDLMFEGYEHAERVPVKCKYNGVHKYVEHEPQANEVTRQWLQDFYRTNGTAFYEP